MTLQASSGLLTQIREGQVNAMASNFANISLYFETLAGTFLAENWYLAIMVTFGGIHAYVAFRKHKREENEAAYKAKDRGLMLAREEEREKLISDMKKKTKLKEELENEIVRNQEMMNREHFNKREELYCEGERRSPKLKSVQRVK